MFLESDECDTPELIAAHKVLDAYLKNNMSMDHFFDRKSPQKCKGVKPQDTEQAGKCIENSQILA
jgi:hypothetical protein